MRQNIQKIRFFGFSNYLNWFIPNYTILIVKALTEPLREPLQKEVDFDWTVTCNEAFVKICVNSYNCLSYFDESM